MKIESPRSLSVGLASWGVPEICILILMVILEPMVWRSHENRRLKADFLERGMGQFLGSVSWRIHSSLLQNPPLHLKGGNSLLFFVPSPCAFICHLVVFLVWPERGDLDSVECWWIGLVESCFPKVSGITCWWGKAGQCISHLTKGEQYQAKLWQHPGR